MSTKTKSQWTRRKTEDTRRPDFFRTRLQNGDGERPHYASVAASSVTTTAPTIPPAS